MVEVPADPQDSEHIPVLLTQVLDGLAVAPGGRYIDGTLGGGGHTRAILQRSAPDGRVLGLDADPAATRRVADELAEAIARGRLTVVHSPFARMGEVARDHDFAPVDGILLDLGVSSFQLATAERGFAFSLEGPLDMRFDPGAGESAADLLNQRDAGEIADILYRYGEETRSRRIARALVASRPIHTTRQLAMVVEEALGRRPNERIHPATRTFQALRIAVNDELDQLARTLPQALDLLVPGGRLAVISFHSLEDRIVKQWMRQEARTYVPDPGHPMGGYEQEPGLVPITKRPLSPSPQEREENPRSRSARLRIAEKC